MGKAHSMTEKVKDEAGEKTKPEANKTLER